jgi:pimeloyl-ACP methyl ester carboxylesterase
LSVGYRTRYSDWEGATHGLEALADALLERLTAAGVGERPLVLVAHSLGGVLIKLMLARAAEPEHAARHGAAAAALRACVFFSCPHFGSRLAELGAWRVLRPAPGVAELRPGNAARLEALNDTLRAAHKRHGVRVLSFLEGTPTRLLRVPVFRGRHIAAEVVAMESAYPGFGELVVLPDSDHIDACKPPSRDAPGYARTLALVREVLAEARAARQRRASVQAGASA